MELTPDGEFLVATTDQGICVFNAATGRLIGKDFLRQTPPVPHLAPAQTRVPFRSRREDGSVLVSLPRDRDFVSIREAKPAHPDAANGTDRLDHPPPKPTPEATVRVPDRVSTLISPDSRWLVAWVDMRARLYDLQGNGLRPMARHLLGGHATPIQSVLIDPDSTWLLTQSADTAQLWDLKTQDPASAARTLSGGQRQIASPNISPDGHWLAAEGDGKTGLAWRLDERGLPSQPRFLEGQEGHPLSVLFTPDSGHVVTWDTWTARFWDLTSPVTARPVIELPAYLDSETPRVAVSKAWLLRASDGHTASLWNLTAGGPECLPRVLRGHTSGIRVVAITPNERWAITGGQDHALRLWDLKTPDPALNPVIIPHPGEIVVGAVSPDSRWLVTGNRGQPLTVFELPDEHRVPDPIVLGEHAATVHRIAISADSQWLLTGDLDHAVWLRKLSSVETLRAPYVWYGARATIPLTARNPQDITLIGNADQMSSLWNERLQQFRVWLSTRHGGTDQPQRVQRW